MASVSATRPRRFEFSAGTAHKFWEIAVHGAQVTVRFGRMGTPGQTTTKSLADAAAAAQHAEKVIRAKTAKGYVAVA